MTPEDERTIPCEALESTARLLAQVRDGDHEARERLARRFLPLLRRWAHGRLPSSARDLSDTDDLVQIALMRALDRVREFEPRHEGAFLAYLRRIVLNSVRDELRRVRRRPGSVELSEAMAADDPSLVEQMVGREQVLAYEAALLTLPAEQQEAVVMRIELGCSYPEIADALGKATANAARMMVSRALVRLAEVLDGR
jgi:RNA polymerase sigma-70 factor (ECF subfamily)